MAKTAADVTATEIESFRQRLRERAKRADPARKARLVHARAVALRAAQVLRERFGATRVVLFGSCLHEEWLTPWSDVDVAAWGIRPEDTFRAMGTVRGLDRSLEVDLIDVAACSPALLATIEAEGQEL
jgi:predicted nucleotidyltransferase